MNRGYGLHESQGRRSPHVRPADSPGAIENGNWLSYRPSGVLRVQEAQWAHR